MRALPVILALFIALPLIGCEDPAGDSSGLVGTKRDFEVETLQSADLKASLKGMQGKPVLLDFWATWCGPCRELTPYVEGIYQKYRSKGLEAMAISNENRTDVERFERNSPHTMPVYIDYSISAATAFNVTGLPTIVVIDKTGTVIYTTSGFDSTNPLHTVKQIDDAVAKAVG